MSKKNTIGPEDNPEHQVEIITDQTIEPIVNQNFDKTIREEEFMNQMVEVEVHATTDENAPPSFMLNVNGVNQPIVRGIPIQIKRKFVEVLARAKETKYKQPTRDMSNPEAGNALIGATAHTYPFHVVDDTPKGKAWLRAVMAEAN